MSQQACKVLCAKYNSARKPDFRVTTEICEDANGVFVRKRAGSAASKAYLENIYKNSVSLRDYYCHIKVTPPEKREGELRFPFIKGQTLAEEINPAHFEKERFIAQVNQKLAAVFSIQEQYHIPFEPTEEFDAVFGKVEIGDVPALNPANIDSLFTNFIENDAGIHCIDCEWVCHFPVPVAFIKYRILLYLYVNQVHAMVDGASLQEMLGWFGLSEQECADYWRMDDHFQQYVHGEGRKYIYIHQYKKRDVPIQSVEKEFSERDSRINEQNSIIHDKDVHIGNLGGIIDHLREQISIRDDINRKQDEHIQNQRAHIQNQDIKLQEQDARIQEQDARIQEQDALIQDQSGQIHDKEVHIQNQNAQIHNQIVQIQGLTGALNQVTGSFFWRITKPGRATMDAFKRVVKKNDKAYRFFHLAKETLRYGPKYTIKKVKKHLSDKKRLRTLVNWPTEAELAKQRRGSFSRDVTFSVLVPLYNTPEAFLREMIKSVQDQTYPKWELCLADGSDGEHAYVGEVCTELARDDKRIKYQKLKKNLGISGNTNACIDMATGDYIALFDHDDILNPSALYENMKAICEKEADFIYSDETTFSTIPIEAYGHHFKPDFAPDTLRSYNYICHLTVFKRSLLDEIGGGFRSQFDGSQDFDIILRLTEKARHIVHIPKILYYWRAHAGSVASSVEAKPYTIDAGKAALAEHLNRVGLKGKVLDSSFPSTYKVQYDIEGEPLISIVIPNMDHVDDLKTCIDSISTQSTWKNWEIIVVENNSKNAETFEYYHSLEDRPEIRIVTWEGGFNFSAICNHGARAAKGDYILLLNNDVKVITPDWLEQMLMFAQRSDVGAVGAMLYYPDDTIQHAGVIIGIGGVAGHSHKCYPRGQHGYFCRLSLAQDLSAVTGACCLVPRRVWEKVDGLDEKYAVAFNDVDLCLRIREAGYLIVWTPYAELYHYESKSRGYENTPEKVKRFEGETDRFQSRWGDFLAAGDPYYNPNLTLEREDFSFR